MTYSMPIHFQSPSC